MLRIPPCPACDSAHIKSAIPLVFDEDVVAKVICGSRTEVFYFDINADDLKAWKIFMGEVVAASARVNVERADASRLDGPSLEDRCADELDVDGSLAVGSVAASRVFVSQANTSDGHIGEDPSEGVTTQSAKNIHRKVQLLFQISH